MARTDSQAKELVVQTQPTRPGAMRGFWRTATGRDRLVMVIGAITLASPIDIMPESILGPLGLVDDATALAAVASTAFEVAKRYRELRRIDSSRTSISTSRTGRAKPSHPAEVK